MQLADCHPRGILDPMMSIAKYNMERVNFSPNLIDAACATLSSAPNRRTSAPACKHLLDKLAP